MTKKIGNYRIIKSLGQGSFGEVYKVKDTSTSQIYALKSIEKYKLKRFPKLKSQLELEVAAMKACDNPNIIKLFDVLKTENKYYLVMECCEGGTLEDVVKRNGRLNEEIVKKWLAKLTDALIILKKLNIMHRDLKPANILLTNSDIEQAELKIADFGFARFLNPNSYTESYLGTPLYMAPEVLHSESYNFKADIWSLGAIIYEILFGIPAFNAQSHAEIYNLHKKPLYFPSEISDGLKDLIQRMLTFDFNERISAEDIKNHPFLNSSPIIQTIENSLCEEYIILSEEESEKQNKTEEDLKVINGFTKQISEYLIGESNYLSSILGFFENNKKFDLAKAIAKFWRLNNENKVKQAEWIIQQLQPVKKNSDEFFELYESLRIVHLNSIKRDEDLNIFLSTKTETQLAKGLMIESANFIQISKEIYNLSCALYLARASLHYNNRSKEIKNYYDYISSMHENYHRLLLN